MSSQPGRRRVQHRGCRCRQPPPALLRHPEDAAPSTVTLGSALAQPFCWPGMLQAELPQLRERVGPLLAVHQAGAMVALGDWSPPGPLGAPAPLPPAWGPGEEQTAGRPEASRAGTWEQWGFCHN